MTPEGKVKKAVRKVIEDAGAYYVMPTTGGYGNSGAPDFVVCHRGRFFGVECKAGGNEPTALQYKNLRKIQESGGVALVVNEHNVDQFKTMLETNYADEN